MRKKWKWGVFNTLTEVHVMPSDDEGNAAGGHVADADCECEPRVLIDRATQPEYKRDLISHNDVVLA